MSMVQGVGERFGYELAVFSWQLADKERKRRKVQGSWRKEKTISNFKFQIFSQNPGKRVKRDSGIQNQSLQK
jgi:hypothetical protein